MTRLTKGAAAVAERPVETPPPDITRPRRVARRRDAMVCSALAIAVLALATLSVSYGELQVSALDIVRTVFGGGTRLTHFLVLDLRLPRAVLGVLAGSALALSGALFQTLLRNELASPDILGISGGAAVATVVGTLLLGVSGLALSGLAAAGALLVAGVIGLLARGGTVAGQRFVLIGVAVSFMVIAMLGWVLTRAEISQAQVALASLVGGVGTATWTGDLIAAVSLGVLGAGLLFAGPALRALQLGDDTATGLGVPAGRRRTQLLTLAVLLAAVGVAGAGPLAFVAFVSAPIARRLVGGSSPALLASALVGALIVLIGDFGGQHLLPGVQVPAGVLTGAIGAPYLLWLLAWRA